MKIKSFTKILVRTPLQSISDAFSIQERAEFYEGLFLSSPELWSEFQKKETLSEKEQIKLKKSIFKYHVRSATRCTPYATFAGSFIADVANKTSLTITDNPRKYIRLDMNFLAVITRYISTMDIIKQQLMYTLNNSVYRVSDAYRYVEFSLFNNDRIYHITAIDYTELLEAIYIYCQEPRFYSEILSLIVKITSVEEIDASRFLNRLIFSQFLTSNIDPSVTGVEPIYELIYSLRRMKDVDEILLPLEEILRIIEAQKLDISDYQEIQSKLKLISENIQIPKNTIQLDLFHKATKSKIDKEIIDELITQFNEYSCFYKRVNISDIAFFKTEFIKKYEDSEVPLSIVMDADLGIGYANNSSNNVGDNTIIDDLIVGNFQTGKSESQISLDNNVIFSHKKFLEWLERKQGDINITYEEIKPYFDNNSFVRFPESFAIFGSIFKKNRKFDKDNFLFLVNSCGGPSGANLLGRFALGDKKVEELCRDVTLKEEENYPDYIFAEIVHLPQSRVGNIILRPCIRNYEIVYIGKSGMPIDKQIDINDILVSVSGGEITLRSKRLNKRIIPRLSSAHNYNNGSLPIYKFLCDLQMQGYSYPVVWDWGIYSNQRYLPRVVYKNLILHSARWIMEENDIKDIPKDCNKWVEYFEIIKKKMRLPDKILYSQGDNNLLISFDNQISIEILVDYIKKYKRITLVEFLFTEENCIVKDEKDKSYTNEILIPVHRIK